jgi:hypothetical protein
LAKTILILAANPVDTKPLRLDEEVREIANGLQLAEYRDQFVLRQQWAARALDVRRAMLKQAPHIVHFCGHGSGEEGIAFESEKQFLVKQHCQCRRNPAASNKTPKPKTQSKSRQTARHANRRHNC